MTTPQTSQSQKETSDLKNTFVKVWREAVKGLPVPKWCDIEKLADTLAQETEQYYIERQLDERIKKVVKSSRNSGEAFIKYVAALDEYCEAMKSMFSTELQRRPVAFYRSDFPLSILSRFDILKHTQIKAYDFLRIWADSFVNKASMYRGSWHKADKFVWTPYSKESAKIADASNSADKACGSLLAYIRIWNVSAYDELLQDKPLTKTKLDPKRFDELYLSFESSLYKLQDTIRELKPELYMQPSAPNSAVEMLGGIIFLERFQ